jgi:hypothetical protein
LAIAEHRVGRNQRSSGSRRIEVKTLAVGVARIDAMAPCYPRGVDFTLGSEEMMNPYERPRAPAGPAPAGGRSTGRLILLVMGFGGLGLCALVLLLAIIGMSMVADDVCAELNRYPVAAQRLGSDLSCDMAFARTGAERRPDYIHYEVTGSKATGIAIVHTEPEGPDGAELIIDGELVVGGQRLSLSGGSDWRPPAR